MPPPVPAEFVSSVLCVSAVRHEDRKSAPPMPRPETRLDANEVSLSVNTRWPWQYTAPPLHDEHKLEGPADTTLLKNELPLIEAVVESK